MYNIKTTVPSTINKKPCSSLRRQCGVIYMLIIEEGFFFFFLLTRLAMTVTGGRCQSDDDARIFIMQTDSNKKK